MARLRYNGLTAALGAPLTAADTAVTFEASLSHSGGTAVPTISGSDYIPLTILDASGNVSEIVYLTAYTSGATSGTITRGQEGTTGAAHAAGDVLMHAPTVSDFSSSTTATPPEMGVLALTAFTNAEMKARSLTSSDGGKTFTELARSTRYADPDSTVGVRDASIVKFAGRYLMAYTRAPFSNYLGPESTWGLASSQDLLSFTHLADIAPTAPTGIYTLWAPDLFVDGDRLYCYWSVATSSGGTHQTYVQYATAADLTSWSTPTLVSGLTADVIDTTVVRNGSQYVAFFKDQGTAQNIRKATATDPAGPFTMDPTPLPTGADHVEGPSVIRLPSGSWRVIYDAFEVGELRYMDSADLVSWSTPVVVTMPETGMHHPSAIWLSHAEIAGLRAQWTRVKSVVAGTNVTVDASDPFNPVVASSGGGGSTTPAFVGCRVWRAAAYSVPNNGGTVPLDTEEFDTDAFHDPTTNPSRLTVPTGKAGYYQLSAGVRFVTNSGGNGRGLDILVNGVPTIGVGGPPSGGIPTTLTASVVKYLAAGDYVELSAFQNTGGAIALDFGGSGNVHYNTLAAVKVG